MPVCNKCDGQGVVTKIVQGDGSPEDKIGSTFLGISTLGISLLFTTRTKQKTCPRCGGLGVVGIDAINLVRKYGVEE